MKIRNVVHKGLRRFIERNDSSGLPAAFVERVRNIVSFLQDMDDVEEVGAFPLGRRIGLRAAAKARGA